MKKHRWLAVLLIIIIVSCSGVQTPVASPTPLSVIKTPNVEPASTFPSPTETEIFASTTPVTTSTVPQRTTTPSSVSSPTSFPTPSEKGPHLVARLHIPKEGDFFIQGDDIVIFDADGHGQQIIDLPTNSEVVSIPGAVSPDGEWLAYYTGGIQDGKLTLFVISLKDQQVRVVTQVITPNYEDGLYKIAEKLAKENQKTSQLTAGDWMAEVQNTFIPGMHSLSWSPDSQTLAFAAQIDGPSSDLYLYDVKTSSIRRLIDDMENVYQLQWSPDGKRILLENAIPKAGGYIGIALYIMQEEGSVE